MKLFFYLSQKRRGGHLRDEGNFHTTFDITSKKWQQNVISIAIF